jgi:hypothetical protein
VSSDWRIKALEAFAVGVASRSAVHLVDHFYKLVTSTDTGAVEGGEQEQKVTEPSSQRFDFQAYVLARKSID